MEKTETIYSSAIKNFKHRLEPNRRYHITTDQNLRFSDSAQINTASHKPRGLWYSFGSEWIDWCLVKEPSWIGSMIYEITLEPTYLLTLSNENDTTNFEEEYGCLLPIELTNDQLSRLPRYVSERKDYINWQKAALKYKGIELCPYKSNDFSHSVWYNSADCSGGCVWDKSAVTKISIFGSFDGVEYKEIPKEKE